MPISRPRAALATAVAVLAAGTLLAGCGTVSSGARPSRQAAEGPVSTVVHGAGQGSRSAPEPMATTTPIPAVLPGLGPRTLAQVPAATRQALVVTGSGRNRDTARVTLYRKDPATGWTAAGPAWSAHNALRGWSDHHHTGDLRSPIGVFTLTDAGGRLADPGTALSYDHAPIGFSVHGTGFHGESLDGAFDYVIAINYNRKPGMSPRDWTRPLGESRGGGIWLHVDHGGPTQGCVSLPAAVMKQLLRTLDPRLHPVVVMGDAASLAR